MRKDVTAWDEIEPDMELVWLERSEEWGEGTETWQDEVGSVGRKRNLRRCGWAEEEATIGQVVSWAIVFGATVEIVNPVGWCLLYEVEKGELLGRWEYVLVEIETWRERRGQ